MKKKPNKSLSQIIKEIRSRKQSGTGLIADAIETLETQQQADFTLLNGIIDEKIRRSKKPWWKIFYDKR